MDTHDDAGLVMFDARKQLKRRGSVNAAYVRVGGTALPDVQVRLFQELHAAVRNRPLPGGVDDALEAFEPRAVAQADKAALGDLEELADPGQDAAAVRRFVQSVVAVRGKGASRVARDAAA